MTSASHRIAFYADIMYRAIHNSPEYWIPPEGLDVEAVLLGGDIHYLPEHLGDMVADIRRTQRDETMIVVVPGNGEYIDQEIAESRRQYREAVTRTPNAIFLDDEAVVLPSGLRVIGSTLWDAVAEGSEAAYMAWLGNWDQRSVDNIRIGDRDLTCADTRDFHHQARAFIETQLRALSLAERERTIVCTHYWPTQRPWMDDDGNLPMHEDSRGYDPAWTAAGYADLEAMVADCGPAFWLCGHAHESKRVTVGKTEVASNPRAGAGPGNVNVDFAERFIVELPRAPAGA